MLTPGGSTPVGTFAMGMKTPAMPLGAMTPEQVAAFRWEKDIDDRNRPLTDEELDALMPPGYKVRYSVIFADESVAQLVATSAGDVSIRVRIRQRPTSARTVTSA